MLLTTSMETIAQPTQDPAPISPTGPLCRFLRSPRLLLQLYQRMSKEKQTRLFELLKYGRNDQAPVEEFITRLLNLLDTAEGRRAAESKGLALPRLLIDFVEQSDPNHQVVHRRLFKLVESREVRRGSIRNREFIQPLKHGGRSFVVDKLTSDGARQIFANADRNRFVLTTAYIIGWALAQPGAARQICSLFSAASADFASALEPGTDEAIFQSEILSVPPLVVIASACRPEPTLSNAPNKAGTVEQHPPLTSPAQSPSIIPSGVATPNWPMPLPDLYRRVLDLSLSVKAAQTDEMYGRIEALLHERKAALSALRQALQPYQDSAVTNGVRTTELNDYATSADIEQHITRLFAELDGARKRSFERQSSRLRMRLQEIELSHLWPTSPPATLEELKTLEQSLEQTLIVREAAMALIGVRLVPCAEISSLTQEQQLQAAQWAVDRVTTGHVGNRYSGRVDISPLLRFLCREGFCREHLGLATRMFSAACTTPVTVVLIELLCRLAKAIADSDPSLGSMWALLFVEGKLINVLVGSSVEILDLLLNLGAAQPETITSWVEFCSRGVDPRPLLLSLVRRLQDLGRHAEAVVLLAGWLHRTATLEPRLGLSHADVMVMCKLRDCLIDDGRSSEAILLVARAHSAGCDELLQDFEEQLTRYMLSITGRHDQEANKVLEALLDEPSWLINSVYGVIAFLYVCHMADKTDWVLSARYRFQEAFARATEFHPVLVGEYFLEYRFPAAETPHTERLGYASRMLEELREFERGLQKRSCYRSWFKAEKYQEIFVQRLTYLKTLLEPGRSPELLLEKLDEISPDRWIEEANRMNSDEVRQPALGLMYEYLEEQLQRLRLLAEARQRLGGQSDLSELLKLNAISQSARLRQEAITMESTHPLIAQVYQRIQGGGS